MLCLAKKMVHEKHKMYIIFTNGTEGETLYLCPRGDNESYVLKDTLLGAAAWSSYKDAFMFKNAHFGANFRIRLLDTRKATVSKITMEERLEIEKTMNR